MHTSSSDDFFSMVSQEDELLHVGEHIKVRLQEFKERNKALDEDDITTVIGQFLEDYREYHPEALLTPTYQMSKGEVVGFAHDIEASDDPEEETQAIVKMKGIRNTLSVLEEISQKDVARRARAALTAYVLKKTTPSVAMYLSQDN